MNIDTDRIIRKLEQDISRYDKIVLLESRELVHECDWELTAYSSNKKILVLSAKQLSIKAADNLILRQITKEEADFLSGMYLTYEFSDKFIFLSREDTNYPGLQNFVDTGLLSREEMLELLLS